MTAMLTLSIVSHKQASLVHKLLGDISIHCAGRALEVVVTLNLPEELPFSGQDFPFQLIVLRNATPLGFAANHNQAFNLAKGAHFCVVNPDIRLNADPFPALLECLEVPQTGVAAPLVLNDDGDMEDSARRFPTPIKILCKALGGCKGGDYIVKDKTIHPDWVGGMFMLFPSTVFKRLGGFDQRFFLYYEDVDLCARLRLHGYEVALCPKAGVIHQARRDSHRSLKYLRWHITSMLRFFCSAPFIRICWLRLIGKYS